MLGHWEEDLHMVRSWGWGGKEPASTTNCPPMSCLNNAECDVFNADNALVKSIAAIISVVAGATMPGR
jgi:hypothetical protein